MKVTLFIPFVIFLCAAYLGFHRLDNTMFWDDEAVVGTEGKNYLETGKLTGWDGRNLLAVRNGWYLDDQLHISDPILQIYVTAASFRLLGVSTWAGRFPFVVFGLLTLVAFHFLLKSERASPAHAAYALGVLAFSVMFLLHIRQCRYFGLSLAFSLMVYLFYRRLLIHHRWLDLLLMTASAVGAFFAQYLLGGCFLLALAVTFLICDARKVQHSDWLKLLISAGAFALGVGPFAVMNKVWIRHDLTQSSSVLQKITLFWWNLEGLNFIGAMPWLMAIIGIWFAIRKRKEAFLTNVIRSWAILCLVFVFFLSLVSPQPFETNIACRYFVPILPFTAGLVGWTLASLPRSVGITLFALITCTNVLSINPLKSKPQWMLPAYVKEIHHDYPTSYSAAVKFLQQAAAKDDVVLACPDYCNFPLMFYLGDKIRIGGLLNKNTLLPRQTVQQLNFPLFINETFPTWLIIFGWRNDTLALKAFLGRPHLENGALVQFQYVQVTNLNVYWYDTSKPELRWHNFGPKQGFNPDSDGVYVLHRSGP